MSKTKTGPTSILPDDANSISVHFYLSDAASTPPLDPRVRFDFPTIPVSFDHALSEYTTVTPGQKATLRSILLALRDETYTKEGYV